MIVACQVMDPGSIPGERKLPFVRDPSFSPFFSCFLCTYSWLWTVRLENLGLNKVKKAEKGEIDIRYFA